LHEGKEVVNNGVKTKFPLIQSIWIEIKQIINNKEKIPMTNQPCFLNNIKTEAPTNVTKSLIKEYLKYNFWE